MLYLDKENQKLNYPEPDHRYYDENANEDSIDQAEDLSGEPAASSIEPFEDRDGSLDCISEHLLELLAMEVIHDQVGDDSNDEK